VGLRRVRVKVDMKTPTGYPCPSLPIYLMVSQRMILLLLQLLKRLLVDFSLLLRIMDIILRKLSIVVIDSDWKLHHQTVKLKEETLMMIKDPTSEQNQMTLNIPGLYLTLFITSLYPHCSQVHLSYLNSM